MTCAASCLFSSRRLCCNVVTDERRHRDLNTGLPGMPSATAAGRPARGHRRQARATPRQPFRQPLDPPFGQPAARPQVQAQAAFQATSRRPTRASGPLREKIPPERIDAVVDHLPAACPAVGRRCRSGPGPVDPEPTWHQVIDLPPQSLVVTEHRGQARTCTVLPARSPAGDPRGRRRPCRRVVVDGLPELHGRPSLRQPSRRAGEVVEALGAEALVGDDRRPRTRGSPGLGTPRAEAGDHVRRRGQERRRDRREGGRGPALALGRGHRDGGLLPDPRPAGLVGLDAAVGECEVGVMTSDRWGAYGSWPLERRQVSGRICHPGLSASASIGAGVRSRWGGPAGGGRRSLFAAWKEFGDRSMDREELRRRLAPLPARVAEAWNGPGTPGQESLDVRHPTCWASKPALSIAEHGVGSSRRSNHAERVCVAGCCGGRTRSAARGLGVSVRRTDADGSPDPPASGTFRARLPDRSGPSPPPWRARPKAGAINKALNGYVHLRWKNVGQSGNRSRLRRWQREHPAMFLYQTALYRSGKLAGRVPLPMLFSEWHAGARRLPVDRTGGCLFGLGDGELPVADVSFGRAKGYSL